MSADFSRVAAALGQGLVEHADRDGLRGVERAVFMDRGGHAPGDHCPTAPAPDPHQYTCQWPDDECFCGAALAGEGAADQPRYLCAHQGGPPAEELKD